MKVAIIHYWFTTWRGGEKVIKALLDIFPDAHIFTHVIAGEIKDKYLKDVIVKETFISSLPRAKKNYQKYLPFMPIALEQLDLSEYDLIISSESGPAKNVIAGPNSLHICYCHSPMRYVWDMYNNYLNETPRYLRPAIRLVMHYMRLADVTSAARVDHFIANSRFISRRIEKFYRRESEVIHPPVDTGEFIFREVKDDYYLILGQLTNYKRADIAVEAFARSGRRLVIIGEGEQHKKIVDMKAPNVEVLGRRPFDEVREYLAGAKALIFPGIEDFGLVPVEAMASGTPVIAYAKGGALETIVDSQDPDLATGVLFAEQTADSINAAVERFECRAVPILATTCKRHAEKFSSDKFKRKFVESFEKEWNSRFPERSIPHRCLS